MPSFSPFFFFFFLLCYVTKTLKLPSSPKENLGNDWLVSMYLYIKKRGKLRKGIICLSWTPWWLMNIHKWVIYSVYSKCQVQIQRVFFVFLFKATPSAYGSSQARGRIGAAIASLHQATAILDLSHICDLCHSLRQCWIFNPLSEARDWTWILMDTMLGS